MVIIIRHHATCIDKNDSHQNSWHLSEATCDSPPYRKGSSKAFLYITYNSISAQHKVWVDGQAKPWKSVKISTSRIYDHLTLFRELMKRYFQQFRALYQLTQFNRQDCPSPLRLATQLTVVGEEAMGIFNAFGPSNADATSLQKCRIARSIKWKNMSARCTL